MSRPRHWRGAGSRSITKDACRSAVDFISAAQSRSAGLALPRVGPSVYGGVALEWDFGDIHFMVRIESGDPARVYYQKEGPRYAQHEGYVSRPTVIKKLHQARRRLIAR